MKDGRGASLSPDTPRRAGAVPASVSVTRPSGVGVLGEERPHRGGGHGRPQALAPGEVALPRAPWALEGGPLFCFPEKFSCSRCGGRGGGGLGFRFYRRYCDKSTIHRKVPPLPRSLGGVFLHPTPQSPGSQSLLPGAALLRWAGLPRCLGWWGGG